MLLLEHVGRVSGARRYAVLEVVDHPARDTYVVASGFGTRAQWFRNVRANPRVRISVAGHGLADATARVLTTAEADQVLAAYITRHPRAWDAFRGVLESTLGRPVVSHDAELPMVELRLDSR
jgi:deazaflavin-dependent oxidoreductase (nitroreductase family)